MEFDSRARRRREKNADREDGACEDAVVPILSLNLFPLDIPALASNNFRRETRRAVRCVRELDGAREEAEFCGGNPTRKRD